MMLPFRGRCAFRMFMPKKPSKYGIKVFSLVDARTYYTSKLEIYAGVQPEGPFQVDNSTKAVSLRMFEHISNSGRNITMDRWFNSFALTEEAFTQHRLTIVGTLNSRAKGIPQEFREKNKRPIPSTVFGFGTYMTLASHVPKKNKNILIISSFHREGVIDESTGDAQKPIITFYNTTKCGVDVNKMISSYSVARNTRRWPLVIFYGMLNLAGINAFIIHRSNNEPESQINRRLFLKQLGLELVKVNIAKRATMLNLPRNIRQTAAKFAGVNMVPPQDPPPNKRGYCKYCKKRQTRYFCKFCKSLLCMEHITACCGECAERNQL